MSVLDTITTLRVGELVLKKYKEEMKSMVFTFDDYEKLQNDYEKILYDLCKEAYNKGKNDLSEKEFNKWLESNCAYIEDDKK